jgi:hypothetical protein
MLEAGPSALYDALAKALGVELITEAIKRLETRARSVRVTESALSAQRRALQPDAAAVDDELARRRRHITTPESVSEAGRPLDRR